MKLNLAADLAELAKRGFPSQRKQSGLLQELHCLHGNPNYAHAHETLYLLRSWLLKGSTFWSPDLVGMINHVCTVIGSGKQLDDKLIALVRSMRFPPDSVHDIIATVEEAMARGDYDWCLTKSALNKFTGAEKIKLADPQLHSDFADLDLLHGVDQYRNPKTGMIRRRFRMERNFLPQEMKFKWETEEDKFRIAWDVFCDNHCLYGYEGSKALLEKLAVYPAKNTIYMATPRYWSLDERRDLNWTAIKALLKAWDTPRQGEKWSITRAERTEQKRLAKKCDTEAKKLGITGPARFDYIIAKLGLPEGTDHRLIRRLLE